MNADIEKGDVDDAKKDVDDLKKDTEGEEAAEDSPLKGNDIPTSETKEGEAKDGSKGGLHVWLSQPRIKWWVAFFLAVVLLSAVLVVTLIVAHHDDFDIPDNARRIVKIWPRPNRGRNLIHFVHGSLPHEGRVWPELASQLDTLLARYQNPANRSRSVVECFAGMKHVDKSKVCKFDTRGLMLECSRSMNYGYDQGKPCIFLEFNNISGWSPEPYTARDLGNLLQASVDDRSVTNMLYLDCDGDTLADRENMGRIQYTPDRGFPTFFFPYHNQPEYMSPIVALRFSKPAIGVGISVTCKFWAKNLNHTDEAVPSGQIQFNLLVD